MDQFHAPNALMMEKKIAYTSFSIKDAYSQFCINEFYGIFFVLVVSYLTCI